MADGAYQIAKVIRLRSRVLRKRKPIRIESRIETVTRVQLPHDDDAMRRANALMHTVNNNLRTNTNTTRT